MNDGYIGSVRFWKHVYLIGLGSLLLILVSFAIRCISSVLAGPARPEDVRGQGQRQTAEQAMTSFAYQQKYPDLFAMPSGHEPLKNGAVYLTFDDGPSPVTERVLDILKRYNIKATFFIVGKHLDTEQSKAIIRRMAAEGHAIGIHTDSHNYKRIYRSVEAYLDDFAAIESKLHAITGVRPTIYRYPGGSINIYNGPIWQSLNAEMTRRGYVHFDWNISNGDATIEKTVAAGKLSSNVIDGASRIGPNGYNVVLMHDSAQKTTTAQSLPSIIEYYLSHGRRFERLGSEYEPMTFSYRS